MTKHPKDCTCKECSGGAMQKGGIKIKPSHKGLLHKDLGVAKDKPIPAKKLEKAEHSSNPAVKKRAVFAENAKDWSHKAQGGTDNTDSIDLSAKDLDDMDTASALQKKIATSGRPYEKDYFGGSNKGMLAGIAASNAQFMKGKSSSDAKAAATDWYAANKEAKGGIKVMKKAQGGIDDGGHTTASWYNGKKKDGPAVKANKGTFVGFKVPKATKDYSAKGPKRKK